MLKMCVSCVHDGHAHMTSILYDLVPACIACNLAEGDTRSACVPGASLSGALQIAEW